MIHLVCALPAEARPLIDRFKLRSRPDTAGFRVHEGDGTRLVVSGVGKIAAAAACGYLGAEACARGDVAAWINIGIAGHSGRDIGEAFLAHRIVDVAGGRAFYPSFAVPPSLPTDTLFTVESPTSEYPPDGALDMEASGFFATASRFATTDRIHVLKVVSDGPQAPASDLDRRRVASLVASQLEALESVIASLREQAREAASIAATPSGYARLTGKAHYSTTHRRRLRKLLDRARALDPERDLVAELDLAGLPARAALGKLEAAVEELPLRIPGTSR